MRLLVNTEMDEGELYITKAVESFDGAESEFANGRYNNSANRCYYACFQAAIAALLWRGIHPSGHRPEWAHTFVHAQFAGELIHRRKLYPSNLRDTLSKTLALRHIADYRRDNINEREASRALRWAHAFLETVQEKGGEVR